MSTEREISDAAGFLGENAKNFDVVVYLRDVASVLLDY